MRQSTRSENRSSRQSAAGGFRFIEELIPLISKHQSLFTATVNLYDEVSWPQF